MIEPEVMQAPVVWLSSGASEAFHNRRVIAYYWDDSVPLEERLLKAMAPIAWLQLVRQSIGSIR